MIVVDSSGWLEYFMNGPQAERYADYLAKSSKVLTPTVVLYEVFKVLKRDLSKDAALDAAAQMGETEIVPLTDSIAYHAANMSLEHHLAMVDSMVYATADAYKAKLVTSDSDFKNLPNVIYLDSESDENAP